MSMDKTMMFIGLSKKAGKTFIGESISLVKIKANKAKLCIIAEDTGKNTRKRIIDKCNYRNIDTLIFGKKGQLGHALGKTQVSVVCVTDENFAKKIKQLIEKKE